MLERTPFAHVHMKGAKKQLFQRAKEQVDNHYYHKGLRYKHDCTQGIIVTKNYSLLRCLFLIKPTGVNWTRITGSTSLPTMPLGHSNVLCWTGQNCALQQS